MTLRGHIKDGAVVLDEPVSLPDGTDIEVEVRPLTGEEGPTLYDRLQDVIGTAEGLPEDMAENHDHYVHGVMKDRGITEALTGDRHFEQAGFVALLK
ncbi:MAG TPA: hypothetical protein VLJ39_02810 [Tepidisphaeraceae bacterium]|nr:hypothetical protein [Tepidisphaeraceae bacterium]